MPSSWLPANLHRPVDGGRSETLPFADHTLTAVLDVLTPANYQEFRRVLMPEGRLIKVYPGKSYLQEIRQARGLPLYAEGQVDAYLKVKAKLIQSERITTTFHISPEGWRDFVWMTPLNQDLSPEEKQQLSDHPQATMTLDLHVTAVQL